MCLFWRGWVSVGLNGPGCDREGSRGRLPRAVFPSLHGCCLLPSLTPHSSPPSKSQACWGRHGGLPPGAPPSSRLCLCASCPPCPPSTLTSWGPVTPSAHHHCHPHPRPCMALTTCALVICLCLAPPGTREHGRAGAGTRSTL